MTRKSLDRRTFLRGACGVAVALPTLEIMLNANGTAYAAGGSLPKRFFVGLAGCALGCDGDDVHNLFVPDAVGAGYDLKIGTASLADHGNVKDQVSIISGLRIPYGNPSSTSIPAGGWWTEFHTEAIGPLISGVRGQYPQDYDVNGPTADQVVAEVIGVGTAFPSLQYQVQAAWYLTVSAPYGRDVISYRRNGNGDLIAVPGQVSPKAAYDALFTAFVPPDDSEALDKARELLKRRSVIDLVRGDFETLIPTLGRTDQIRLELHLEQIRELERQLETDPPELTETCFQFADPGEDPSVGGAQEGTYGSNFDVNLGWSEEDVRAQRFADLIHMAYTCDLSRSVSLLYTMFQSHMNIHSYTGQPYDQHELGHSYLGTDVFSVIPDWHVDKFGYLVAKLRDTPEGAGTVLDNCAMVLLFEAGHGYDPATGDDTRTHSTENMAVCTAGGAGGLHQGEHIVADGMHPVNVLNTAMLAVGVNQDLGEVNGTIPGLI